MAISFSFTLPRVCLVVLSLLCGCLRPAYAQVLPDSLSTVGRDSLYIAETEATGPDKVLHAEPLYIDLIRDLGARKGEREWNVGLGLTDNTDYDEHTLLVEYEWAPVNRLGLEVEVPLTFYSGNRTPGSPRPNHQLSGFKTAIQYSFFVSEKLKTSMAIGYINELTANDLNRLNEKPITGNVYSPFFVAAKRWGNSFHTLIYTGPIAEQHFATGHTEWFYQHNTSFHYLIPGTRNFLGLEINQLWGQDDFDTVLRPQMRVSLADNLLIGIVGGIPIDRETERLSTFLRLIYEPGHRGPR
ncbi:phosphoribosylformylglycinamidine synthase [Hymenobacter aerilatus]|uniref:Phosphoribosylformylglycinamidine synthase n=1 Tax=Hymenobacter aerilatus TaxID=2932251 RepID=A0A8T9T6U1_9BACT|nr:HAEPLYID family protein [Hymenobacter aerilatus]UOR07529.1 phosphoribosylformylglycinamidine synthase [Hymenobacter aerilatus]